jgi:hypothetical protein
MELLNRCGTRYGREYLRASPASTASAPVKMPNARQKDGIELNPTGLHKARRTTAMSSSSGAKHPDSLGFPTNVKFPNEPNFQPGATYV